MVIYNMREKKILKYRLQIITLSIFIIFLFYNISLSESVYRQGNHVYVKTFNELTDAIDRYTRNLETSFSFTIEPNLWKKLEINRFETITNYCFFRCGIDHSNSYYISEYNLFALEEIEYYPGWKIANKELMQLDNVELTDRELETLYTAKEVSELVEGKSEMEKERIIHDVLCDWITYTIDETTDEDDNAVGAILNGKANCDGYTDAFYLLCSLAGLEAGYMGYDVYSEEENNSDNTHIWNLVKTNGKWVMVDVTWDDSDGDLPTTYAYYNIGRNRASQTHIWEDWMVTVPWIEDTETELRPSDYEEYEVKTTKDLNIIANICSTELLKQVALLPDENMRILFSVIDNFTDDLMSPILFSAGIKMWQSLRVSGNKYILIHNIEYYPEIEEKVLTGKEILSCSSKSEMERVVRRCMQSMPANFVLWYKNGYDFTQNSDALKDAIYQMGCDSFSWSSNKYGRVEISEIQYYPEIEENMLTGKEILSCSSKSEMERVVRRCMQSMPSSFALWYKDGYDFTQNSDALSNMIYRMGCKSFSWSSNGYGRVEISKIEYYPEFSYCDTENEIKQYVKSCVSKEVKEFYIFLPEQLYESLHANKCERWFKLLESLSVPEQYKKHAYSTDSLMRFMIKQE